MLGPVHQVKVQPDAFVDVCVTHIDSTVSSSHALLRNKELSLEQRSLEDLIHVLRSCLVRSAKDAPNQQKLHLLAKLKALQTHYMSLRTWSHGVGIR